MKGDKYAKSFPMIQLRSDISYANYSKKFNEHLRLVFTSDGVEVKSRKRSRKSAYDLVKIKNRSGKRSHECDVMGIRSGRINQSQCTFPRFAIGLVLPLLFATPTTKFSLDRIRQSRKRNHKNQNAVFT